MSKVIWITGLSASGKTTLASAVTKSLKEKGHPTIMLDGDILRECFGIEGQTSRRERLKIAFTYSRLCRMISEQNINVVIATIALFKEVHVWNRAHINNYFEVFLDVPIFELQKRDQKGIYEKALKGTLKNVAGIDLSVDFPANPNLHFKYNDGMNPEEMKNQILSKCSEK